MKTVLPAFYIRADDGNLRQGSQNDLDNGYSPSSADTNSALKRALPTFYVRAGDGILHQGTQSDLDNGSSSSLSSSTRKLGSKGYDLYEAEVGTQEVFFFKC
jgi:hypothetical protein